MTEPYLALEEILELIDESERSLLRAQLHLRPDWAHSFRERLRTLNALRARAEAREAKTS